MKDAERKGALLALLFIDLDSFKEENDRLGHDGGDAVLKGLAERICLCVRGADSVARLGGDEFVVMLKDIGEPHEVNGVAAKLLDEIRRPLEVQEETVHMSASIGVALFPRDGASRDELVRKSDHAMYAVKASGGNGFRLYAGDMEEPGSRRRG